MSQDQEAKVEVTDYTRQAALGISSACNNIEREIIATRTSERRNLLTEVNIHLMMAQQKLEEIEGIDSGRVMQFEDTEAKCTVPPTGWTCTRRDGHDGPCAAWPV